MTGRQRADDPYMTPGQRAVLVMSYTSHCLIAALPA